MCGIIFLLLSPFVNRDRNQRPLAATVMSVNNLRCNRQCNNIIISISYIATYRKRAFRMPSLPFHVHKQTCSNSCLDVDCDVIPTKLEKNWKITCVTKCCIRLKSVEPNKQYGKGYARTGRNTHRIVTA